MEGTFVSMKSPRSYDSDNVITVSIAAIIITKIVCNTVIRIVKKA